MRREWSDDERQAFSDSLAGRATPENVALLIAAIETLHGDPELEAALYDAIDRGNRSEHRRLCRIVASTSQRSKEG